MGAREEREVGRKKDTYRTTIIRVRDYTTEINVMYICNGMPLNPMLLMTKFQIVPSDSKEYKLSKT